MVRSARYGSYSALVIGSVLFGLTCATAGDSQPWRVEKVTGDVWVSHPSVQRASLSASSDLRPGDNITTAYTTATFADKNVGTGKSVSVNGISIGGGDAGNYTFNTAATTTANVTARTLTVSAAGVNKTYD